MAEFLEVMMVFSFGLAWPTSIAKASAPGRRRKKACLSCLSSNSGTCAGVTSKFAAGRLNYVVIFYVLNFAMVSFDILLYIRNSRLDKKRDRQEQLNEALCAGPGDTPAEPE
jgi:hypothetical protein